MISSKGKGEEILKKEVERTLGHELRSAADYERLSELVMAHLNEYLSPTTLKRFWGYLPKEKVTTRTHTLDVLARFTGYRDFDTLCQRMDALTEGQIQEVQSGILVTDRVNSYSINPGQIIEVRWNPDRRIKVRHHGDGRFEILEADNTKLSVSDTFECHLMIQHEPLYLDRLVHEGGKPVAYVAGMRDGVVITV